MRIVIGCDHGGFPLKEPLLELLKKQRHQIIDVGTFSGEAVDYPDYAVKIAQAIQSRKAQRGIFICGSGVGASIAVNKFLGIRACLCHDTYSAHQGVEHDDMNVLCLGARVIGPALAVELVTAFLSARFSHEARHRRRVGKVNSFDRSRGR
jgi:ribose 5-phosphate isomerase B